MKKTSNRKQKIDHIPLLFEELNLIYKELLNLNNKLGIIETKLDIKQILEKDIDK